MVSYRSDDKALELYAGSAWQPILQGRNAVINGAFDVWQRGSSFTSPSFSDYTADRFKNNNYDFAPTTYSVTRQAFTPGAEPVAGVAAQYFYRSTITTVGSNTQYDTAQQRIEDVSTFANSTVTISFYAKADSARIVKLGIGQVFGSGGSGAVNISNFAIDFNLTTSWQRFSATVVVPSITGKTIGAGSYFWFAFRQASASGSVLDLWGIQAETGSIATPFTRAGGTIQGELAECQRYYQRFTAFTAFNFLSIFGSATSTTNVQLNIPLLASLRVIPTSVGFSNLSVSDGPNNNVVSNLTIDANTNRDLVTLNATSTGLTQFRPYCLRANNTTAAFFEINAEL
jgi:hypothetical protein